MTDVAALVIKSDSRQIKSSTTDLDNLTNAATKSEKSTMGASKGFGTIGSTLKGITPIVTGLISAFGIKEIARVAIETENYNAILKTATGSAMAAGNEFNRLNNFARETPFTLKQSIDGFVQLKNLGLDPSERAMASFGNTSAAMGKSLTQMVEAVADASTNEFERLKEFGIKAKQEGENVTFTFRGVETTIQKSSENIQEYLIALGENNFGSAMADQMDTVKGQASNVVQSFDDLLRAVGDNANAQEIMKTALQGVSDIIVMLTNNVPAFFNELRLISNFITSNLVTGLDHLVQGFENVQIIMDNWGDGLDVVNIKLEQNALVHEQLRKQIDADTDATAANIMAQEKAIDVVSDSIVKTNEQADALTGTTNAVGKQEKAFSSLIDKLFPAEAQARKVTEQENMLQAALDNGTITWSRYAEALSRLSPIEEEQISLLDEQGEAVERLAVDYDGLTSSIEKSEKATMDSAGSSSGGTTTHTGALQSGGLNNDGRFGTGVANQFGTQSRTFAQGGSFTVGGVGGVDSQPVNFMASPGEKVTVDRNKTGNTTNQGGPVTIIMNGIQNVKQFAKELESYSRTNPIAINVADKGVVSG